MLLQLSQLRALTPTHVTFPPRVVIHDDIDRFNNSVNNFDFELIMYRFWYFSVEELAYKRTLASISMLT